jgi:WD40 repeat protein
MPPTAPWFEVLPALPRHHQPRLDYLERIHALMGSARRRCLVLQGMDGAGKTTLAAEFARQEETLERFPDGVFWLRLGQAPDLHAALRAASLGLGDGSRASLSPAGARACLEPALRRRRCLLVLDDVRDVRHAHLFAEALGKECRLLVATPLEGLEGPLEALRLSLAPLEDESALRLLASWAGLPPEALPEEAHQVALACGKLPLSLALAGGMAASAPQGWAGVLQHVRAIDLAETRRLFPEAPHPDWLRPVLASLAALDDPELERLTPGIRQRLGELVIFSPGEPIPLAAIRKLWAQQGWQEGQITRALGLLEVRGLCQRSTQSSLQIHDRLRIAILKKRELPGEAHARLSQANYPTEKLHARLLQAYNPGNLAWESIPDDGYLYDHLAYHLLGAGRAEALGRLLLDFPWLQARLERSGILALLRDYQTYLNSPAPQAESRPLHQRLQENLRHSLRLEDHLAWGGPAMRLERHLRLAAPILDQNPDQLAAQLHARLQPGRLDPHLHARRMEQIAPELRRLLQQAARCQPGAWLRPLTPSLRRYNPQLGTLRGHSGPVNAVAAAPDGWRAVSASGDGTLIVWDFANSRSLQTLEGHESPVNCVALTPDGRRVVSGAEDGLLMVWDLLNGEPLRAMRSVYTMPLGSVAIAPDGRRAVVAAGGMLFLWDLHSGELLREANPEAGRLNGVAISPDGRQVVSTRGGPFNKKSGLILWDLDSLTPQRVLDGHAGEVNSVAISPDGRLAVSASSDQSEIVWDLASGKPLRRWGYHWDPARSVAIAPDGKRVVAASGCILHVWDLPSGQRLMPLEEHEDWVNGVAVTPDGRVAISASNDQSLIVWDLYCDPLPETRMFHFPYVDRLVRIPSLWTALSTSSGSNDLILWDLTNGTMVGEMEGGGGYLEGQAAEVNEVAVSADGKRVVSASADGTLIVWDLVEDIPHRTLASCGGPIYHVAVTPDGRRAVSASEDTELVVWDLTSGRPLRGLPGHNAIVEKLVITADGARLLSADWEGKILLWELDSGRLLRSLQRNQEPVCGMVITPDDRRVIAASADGAIQVWDLAGEAPLHCLAGDAAWNDCLALTPDSKLLVTATADHALVVWDLESGQALRRMVGHHGVVNAIALTPDGRRVVSVSLDGSLIVWDLHSAAALARFVDEQALYTCAVAPDGRSVAAGGSSGRVHFLRLEAFPG